MIARLAIVLLALLLPGCGRDAPARPNVVLVVIDTLRADHCSAYGYFRETTPNLEALASRGLLLENAWSQAPWTCPSMVSLFTGSYVAVNYKTMPEGIQTLAERFKAAGYSTGALVANPVMYRGTGFERGFDLFESAEPRATETALSTTNLPADRFTPKAVALLTGRLEEPYFVWLHLFDPHLPHHAPERFREAMTGKSPGLTPEYFHARQPPHSTKSISSGDVELIEEKLRAYDMEVAFADEALGAILAALDPRTVVAVTSDHGEGLFSHACYPEMKQPSYGHGLYVDHGLHVYEEALHVPLVLAGAGVPRGVRGAGLVENIDLHFTLLRLAGIEPRSTGKDLLNLEGKAAVFAFGALDYTVRTRDGRKYIHPTMVSRAVGGNMPVWNLADEHTRDPMLFDLRDDPDELKNLGREDMESMNRFRKSLEHWREENIDALPDSAPMSGELEERLRKLGYL